MAGVIAVSLIVLVGLLSSTAGASIVVIASLALLVYAIVALVRSSRPGRIPARSRKVPSLLLAAALVLFMSGTASAAGHSGGANESDEASSQTEALALVDSEESPTPTPTPTPTVVVATERVEVNEPIPFTTSNVEDAAMDKGTTRVATAGVEGTFTKVYEVVTEDGVEVSRSLVEERTSVEPVNEVIAIGTKEQVVAPPPAPEPAGDCDSNYADACVPIASDVDCAGGSGNGPAYVDGPVRIVGSDVYDLDNDGDGIACDS
jgi:hypothetical protein